ncbi:MAG: NAD(P)-dependent alcohol dehydrogenase [Candidatus Thiodiazotropha sp. (ex Lucinoma borealis)]|nr:NAD(P)-dependent alcohol dehydrogenase [Candidatus Thiodiazotropha sp. (ex Lucinoma borealis)]
MKAIAWTKYGAPEVLKLIELEKPSPKKDEVLIKVHASSVTAGDCRLRAFKVPMGFWLPTRLAFGLTKPRNPIPGMDISGEIESIGKNVKLFKEGDKVYGTTGMRLGANAEYTCLSENAALVKKPNNISHEQAVAIIFGGLTAIHFLKDKANIQRGQKILVNGASGAVGTASIQLAKYFGAEVTAICSTSNIELIASLGAKKVIDYTKEDFTKNNETYDVILDAVGNLSLLQCKKSLKKQGKLILINTGLLTNLLSIIRRNLICGVAGESKEGLDFLRERIEAGDIEAVVDKIYPLEQTAEAHRYVDTGHKKGNVVISVGHKET